MGGWEAEEGKVDILHGNEVQLQTLDNILQAEEDNLYTEEDNLYTEEDKLQAEGSR